MGVRLRIIVMMFLQYFIWGAWLITVGVWWFNTKGWPASNFGAIFSTMGIASLFMPTLSGIIADKFINAEKLYGIFHILGGVCLIWASVSLTPLEFFVRILIAMCFYMPTLALANSVAYSLLEMKGLDIVKVFPSLRVFGTIGFIVAMWGVGLLHLDETSGMFYLAGISAIVLGIYSFTFPKCSRFKQMAVQEGVKGKIFSKRLVIFFFFSVLLGAALQLTNAYGAIFLHSFHSMSQYSNSVCVKYPSIILSISQISETVMILFIPFFLSRFGIKKVIMLSMVAWIFRFLLFGFGNPGSGLWMIILSCIIYGVAFDFFIVSGSLYTEKCVAVTQRSRAQGIYQLMVNGIGAILGSLVSGWVISRFFMLPGDVIHFQGIHGVWVTFSLYALVIAVVFWMIFKEDKSIIK